MREHKSFGSRTSYLCSFRLFVLVSMISAGVLLCSLPAHALSLGDGLAAGRMSTVVDLDVAEAEAEESVLDDSFAVDSGDFAFDALETGELPSGTPVDQDVTYSHVESVESDGVMLTVYWDEPQLGSEVHFHVVCSGGSGEAQARMDAPYYYAPGESYASGKSLTDSFNGGYQSYIKLTSGETDYLFRIIEAGNYCFSFYLVDAAKGIDEPLLVQVSIALQDASSPIDDSEPEPTSWSFGDVDSSVAHFDDIGWLASAGYSTGWIDSGGNRTFRPYLDVARADMAAFLYRLAGSPEYAAPSVSPFIDVDSSTAHYKEICWLASTGISEGWSVLSGREFRPYAAVARCDMAAFLYRLACSPAFTVSDSPFADCDSQTPHYREVCWLASTGISAGWDVVDGKEFRPYVNVARSDMAAFLHRAYDRGLIGDFVGSLRI